MLLCSGVLALAACTDPDPMNSQPRYEAFERSDFFADGRAMRPLVEDTVPQEWRAWLVPGPGAETGLLPDGGWAQSVPLPVSRALLEDGRSRFDSFCAVCHGLAGNGESIVAMNMPQRRPPSLIAPHRHAVEVVYGAAEQQGPYARVQPEQPGSSVGRAPAGDAGTDLSKDTPAAARARRVAGEGAGGTTPLTGRSEQAAASGDLPHPPGYYYSVISEGYGVMPSYARELSPRERWAVVAWLRVLARSQRAPLDAAPPEVRARLLQQPEGKRP